MSYKPHELHGIFGGHSVINEDKIFLVGSKNYIHYIMHYITHRFCSTLNFVSTMALAIAPNRMKLSLTCTSVDEGLIGEQ